MENYKIHNFGDDEIQEYEGTQIPKSFWGLIVGLILWGVYYVVTYFNFVPEALR